MAADGGRDLRRGSVPRDHDREVALDGQLSGRRRPGDRWGAAGQAGDGDLGDDDPLGSEPSASRTADGSHRPAPPGLAGRGVGGPARMEVRVVGDGP